MVGVLWWGGGGGGMCVCAHVTVCGEEGVGRKCIFRIFQKNYRKKSEKSGGMGSNPACVAIAKYVTFFRGSSGQWSRRQCIGTLTILSRG